MDLHASKRLTSGIVLSLFIGAVAVTAPSPAEAIVCASNQFLLTGTFTDQATGLPITTEATVRVISVLEGVWDGSTKTVLPSSTYSICVPVKGNDPWGNGGDPLAYGVSFAAPGYVKTGFEYEALIKPVPAPGTRVVIDESQARPVDIFQSELFFTREDGLYRAYDPRTNGSLPSPIISGNDWPQTGPWQYSYFPLRFWAGISHRMFAYGPNGEMYVELDPVSRQRGGFAAEDRWDLGTEPGWSIVTAGWEPGRVLFYRDDGIYQWRVVSADYRTISDFGPAGSRWTKGWTSIVPIDLNGDGRDELLFYRKSDGLFRYYYVKTDGSVSTPIQAGDGYTTGWDTITAVDLDGDGQDEIFFYRRDGLFRFYQIRPNGSLPSPSVAGNGYTKGWDSVTRFESCLVSGSWACRFTGE